MTYAADPLSWLIDLGDSISKNEVLWVWPVQKSCGEREGQESMKTDGDHTIRSVLISLPSVVLIVAQEPSD